MHFAPATTRVSVRLQTTVAFGLSSTSQMVSKIKATFRIWLFAYSRFNALAMAFTGHSARTIKALNSHLDLSDS